MIVLDLSILNQKGTPMFNSDTFANRPAFGIVGRIFISTDTKEFFRDTGTSWELIGGPGSGTITGSGAATQVAFWNSASTITGSNNLFWDSTNNYLGINTNAPTTALDVHHSTNSGAIFNQTTGTNNNTINFQTSGSGRWRIGNFYTAGADDFGIFDVVGSLQQLTILKTTGQTFIGAKTTASGRLVVNSSTADSHLQIVGANAPSIRIDNAGSGGTQRFVFGLATATNNFIQGATAGEFCISTQSAGNMLFGMWQTINASEVMRITTANNLVIGSTFDGGQKLQVIGTAYISGNVGIGISAPLTFRASVYLNGAGIQNTLELNNIHQTVGVVDGVRLKIREFNIESSSTFGSTNNILTFGHSTNKQLTLTEAGNFGIGTTSPQSQLHIYNNSAGATFRLQGTRTADGEVGVINFSNITDIAGGYIIGSIAVNRSGFDNGGAMIFSTATAASTPTERLRITSGGNLLVGTTTDTGFKLNVNGSGIFNSLTTSQKNTFNNNSGRAIDCTSTGVLFENSGGSHNIIFGDGAVRYFSLFTPTGAATMSIRNFTSATDLLTFDAATSAATFSSSIAINNTLSAAVAAPSTHKVAILIGGVQYYLLASNI